MTENGPSKQCPKESREYGGCPVRPLPYSLAEPLRQCSPLGEPAGSHAMQSTLSRVDGLVPLPLPCFGNILNSRSRSLSMRAIISHYHEKTNCTWCQRDTEAVTVEFDGGFLQKGPLCWKCLQQATRVHHKQHEEGERPAARSK